MSSIHIRACLSHLAIVIVVGIMMNEIDMSDHTDHHRSKYISRF